MKKRELLLNQLSVEVGVAHPGPFNSLIMEEATMVRIGIAIFGDRDY